jgi:hypothetical protein
MLIDHAVAIPIQLIMKKVSVLILTPSFDKAPLGLNSQKK